MLEMIFPSAKAKQRSHRAPAPTKAQTDLSRDGYTYALRTTTYYASATGSEGATPVPRHLPFRGGAQLAMHPLAYALAVGSAACNATFFAPNRLQSVKDANIHPFVYNWYTTTGVLVFSWVVALFLPLVGMDMLSFTSAGFIAGGLFTLALCFSCLALPLLGLSVAMGVWCSMAILVSFAWGTVGPESIAHELVSLPFSLCAIVMVVIGCIGIINVDALGDIICCKKKEHSYFEMLEKGALGRSRSDAAEKALGIFYAACVGGFGGSMLVPLSFVPKTMTGIKGIAFIPSFGTGSFLTGTAIVTIWWLLGRLGCIKREPIKWEVRRTLWAGLTSGTIWQIGNVCQVVAQSYYLLPYAIAYPIFQASLVIAGLLGIFAFHEIKGTSSVSAFFLSALIVVAGSILLAVYGPI